MIVLDYVMIAKVVYFQQRNDIYTEEQHRKIDRLFAWLGIGMWGDNKICCLAQIRSL